MSELFRVEQCAAGMCVCECMCMKLISVNNDLKLIQNLIMIEFAVYAQKYMKYL